MSSKSPFGNNLLWIIAIGFANTNDTVASEILSPVAVAQNTLGERNSDVELVNAYDQSGLSLPFVSGVTDFDTYLAGTPLHTFRAINNEWFAPSGTVSGAIDWDLGDSFVVDAVAVWNEEATGVENLRIFASEDPTFSSSSFVGDFTLSDNDRDNDYVADVLAFDPTIARFIRFEIQSAYPDPRNAISATASLGEVAFSVSVVPEPHSLAVCIGVFLSPFLWRRRTMGCTLSRGLRGF